MHSSVLETPFAAYLDTNSAPSNKQIEQVNAFLKEPQERLSNLDNEIHRLSLTLENLRTTREGLGNDIDKHLAFLHPIRRIPQEILQEVFAHCISTNRNPTMSATEAPMLLTRICSNWRAVALNTPSLWSRIHIPVPHSFTFYPPYGMHTPDIPQVLSDKLQRIIDLRVGAVRCWLERSGACLLSISYFSVETYGLGSAQVIDALIPFSRRWNNLELNASLSHLHRILDIDVAEVPYLRSIKLIGPLVTNTWDNNLTLKERRIFTAPSIREVALELACEDPLQFPLKWSSLTHFSKCGYVNSIEHGFSIQGALTLFTRCSNLVFCRLEILERTQDPLVYPESTISLPRLESLWLFEAVPLEGFVERLHLPVLRELTFFTYVPSRAQSTLMTILANSNGTVQTLTTNTSVITKTNIIVCLRYLPNLKKLVSRFFHIGAPTPPIPNIPDDNQIMPGSNDLDFDDDILELMSLDSTNIEECLCPDLEDFHYLNSRGCKLSDQQISAFIRSRLQTVQPQSTRSGVLKSVALIVDRPRQLDIREQSRDILPDRFTLKLKYHGAMTQGQFPLNAGLNVGSPDDIESIFTHPVPYLDTWSTWLPSP